MPEPIGTEWPVGSRCQPMGALAGTDEGWRLGIGGTICGHAIVKRPGRDPVECVIVELDQAAILELDGRDGRDEAFAIDTVAWPTKYVEPIEEGDGDA